MLTDHPRSRGVYSTVLGLRLRATGSSPLARGLRRQRRRHRRSGGIIPARAGFTGMAGLRQRVARGSSPLARGLQVVAEAAADEAGIIPARAGFTSRHRIHDEG